MKAAAVGAGLVLMAAATVASRNAQAAGMAGALDQVDAALSGAWNTVKAAIMPLPIDPQNPNLRAFLLMIRNGEGTAGPNGYRTLFGGGLFDSFADHPRRAITRPLGNQTLTSTAAGAYQFLSRTWDEARAALNLPDFSPASQDMAAGYLIRRRGALGDVYAGRLASAVLKCAKEWASLPGSPYGQPTKPPAEVQRVYLAAGGTLEAGSTLA